MVHRSKLPVVHRARWWVGSALGLLVIVGGIWALHHHAGSTREATKTLVPSASSQGLPTARMNAASSGAAPHYASLAQTVAKSPVASLTQVHQALAQGNMAALGEMHWSKADALAIMQALGRRGKPNAHGDYLPSSTTPSYALMFLYAGLSNNVSVFNAPINQSSGGPDNEFPWTMEYAPTDVAQVLQVSAPKVQKNWPGLIYEYQVTFLRTNGIITTAPLDVNLEPSPLNPVHDWGLNTVAYMVNSTILDS